MYLKKGISHANVLWLTDISVITFYLFCFGFGVLILGRLSIYLRSYMYNDDNKLIIYTTLLPENINALL